MKVENKTIKVDQELTREIDFNDKAIDKIYIKSGPRKDFKFRNIKVSQQTFSRFLMGYHKRFDHLVFDEDEKGCGIIRLRDFSDWKS
jgi:hypothetical protein|tara:strand:- start:450 stop:710 length:261 start_codon:yes stop_codon:yes gene_type:complete